MRVHGREGPTRFTVHGHVQHCGSQRFAVTGHVELKAYRLMRVPLSKSSPSFSTYPIRLLGPATFGNHADAVLFLRLQRGLPATAATKLTEPALASGPRSSLNSSPVALNCCLPSMGCFHSKEDYPSEPVTEQPGSASVPENDPKLTPNPDSDDAATTRAPTREENGKLDNEGPGTPTAVAAAQAKADVDSKPGLSGAGKPPASDTKESKAQAPAAESGGEADDASEAGTSSPVAGESVSPRSAEPEPVISRSDSKTPASPKAASPTETAPHRAESAAQVSPKRAPSNVEVSPKRAPSNAEVSPKRAPSNAEVSPKRAPSNAEVSPKRAPSIPEVSPKRAPSGAEVSPKRAPSSAEVSPKRAPSNAEVPPKRAPSGATVTPKRAPSAKMIPKRAPTLPKAVPSGNEEPAAQGKQEEGEVPSPNA